MNQDDYKKLFEQVNAIIVVIDTGFNITAVSNQAAASVNKTREEIVGKSVFAIFPNNPYNTGADSHVLLREAYSRMLYTKRTEAMPTARYQVPLPEDKGGGYITKYWGTSLTPMLDDEGNLRLTMIRTTDVTENELLLARYAQEKKALEESEKKFRVMMDTLPIKINTSNADGNTFFFNRQWRNETDLGFEELSGWGWKDLIHPGDLRENMQNWRFSLATRSVFNMERRIKMKDGIYRWNLSRSVPVMDKDDKVLMWITSNTDIHEQKVQEQALEKAVGERTLHLQKALAELTASEEKFNSVFHFAPYCLTLAEAPSGNFVHVNETFLKTFGLERAEAIGSNSAELGLIETGVRAELMNELAESRSLTNIEKWLKTKDNGLSPFLILSQVVKAGTGDYFLTAMVDISERKKIEEALRQTNKELEAFAYISSHDMQEPLRKIQLLAGRMIDKEREQLSERGKNYLRLLEQETSRMQTLIQDLLAFSRVNIEQLRFEHAELQTIVDEVKTELSETIAEKQAQIVMGNTCAIYVINFQFRQLMHNLLSNALKFSTPGVAPIITIASGAVQHDKWLHAGLVPGKKYCRITVQDNGIGFPQEYSGQIFEAFKRLHSKDEYPGTGIGLAIVKKIIDSHFGVIIANSEQGKGTLIEIYIPKS